MNVLTMDPVRAALVAAGVVTIYTDDERAPDEVIGQHIGIASSDVKPDVGLALGEWRVGTDCNGYPPPVCLWSGEGAAVKFASLPLGCIVATAVLDDCLPMVGPDDALPPDFHRGLIVQQTAPAFPLVHPRGEGFGTTLTLFGPPDWWGDSPAPESNVTDQLPYGDFRPGRWAWLLRDVEPVTEKCPACHGAPPDPTLMPGICVSIDGDWWHDPFDPSCGHCSPGCATCMDRGRIDPIPFKGGQGLSREWTP